MEPIITAVILAWLFMRGWEAVRAEWVHTRDSARTDLRKEHPDWSDGRIRRNARWQARSYWWQEIASGLPTFRSAWTKHRLAGQIRVEEGRAKGERSVRQLRERLEMARKDRIDAAKADDSTEPEEAVPVPADDPDSPGDGTWPPLRPVPDADGTGSPVPDEAVPEAIPFSEWATVRPNGTGPTTAHDDGKAADSFWLDPSAPRCEGCGGTGTNPSGPQSACPACHGWGNAPADPTAPEAEAGTICTACGNPGRPGDPVLDDQAGPIHRSHATEKQEAYQTALKYMKNAPASNGQHPEPQPEGEPVTTDTAPVDVEQGETPFEGLQLVLGQQAKYARAAADHAQDQLIAYAITHGFDRDPAVMAQLQAIHDAAEAHANAAEGAQRVLVANHTEGAEYHGTGQDAHASAFRPGG